MNSDKLASVFLGMWMKLNKYNENADKNNVETLKNCVSLMKNHVSEVEIRVSKLESECASKRNRKRREKDLLDDDYIWTDDYDFDILKTSQSEVPESKYSSPSKKLKTSSSLVDPEWEIVDPTPDIYTLFITFNNRFFWGSLSSVEVRWSPRMYSCAGVCVYEGRRGMCSVRLSEPLLKLRPRSDLVETLLHEMIHAYLFVTHNNRDRDGHGPEFHKHMYRINKEAGTNISVYHSFHDEVKLYQKHWWRCDGPCQLKPPFFGMVKRSMNRAPGPADFWWTTHQATCGGKFIKVREPENTRKKQVKPNSNGELSKTGKNMKDFFNNPTKNQGSNVLSNPNPKNKPFPNSSKSPLVNSNPKVPSAKSNGVSSTITSATSGFQGQNVFGVNSFKGNGGPQTSKKPNSSSGNVKPGVNRVVGFGDIKDDQPKSNVNSKGSTFGGSGQKLGGNGVGNPWKTNNPRLGGALMNRGGGTLVITAKGGQKTQTKQETKDFFVPFNGQGQKLGSSSVGSIRTVSGHGRTCSLPGTSEEKLFGHQKNQSESKYSNKNPLKRSQSTSMSDSICKSNSTCSSTSSASSKESNLVSSLESSFNSSAITVSDEELADVVFTDFEKDPADGEDDVKCPVCSRSLTRDDMSIHLESCDVLKATIANINNSSSLENKQVDSDDDDYNESAVNSPSNSCSNKNVEDCKDPMFPCPCCSKPILESQINKHLDECLSLLALQEFGNAF